MKRPSGDILGGRDFPTERGKLGHLYLLGRLRADERPARKRVSAREPRRAATGELRYLLVPASRDHAREIKARAALKANLDYKDEADAMEKLRLSMALGPLVTAMYAASPLRDGKPAGYQSFRAACWLDTAVCWIG